MMNRPNAYRALAICCIALAAPFPSLASDRDDRVTPALETVQEIAEFSAPGSMPTPLVRRCFVAVDMAKRKRCTATKAKPKWRFWTGSKRK